ncbi:dipeptidase PepV [Oenococcus oeni]|uniref:dipeptidase PepV n=1 Tax=Oenococcus oeni TaxID=1247 RepID=UPI000277BC9C|nr:dipeptidase PepV [Oenococcus oeni]KGH67562.1 peptidase M20 [Oenococcus oeni IOEB_B16]EJO07656.1 dipeptidase [Oenococcus oeni AWRIB548]OIL80441.1 peptidase M20 [Oenococcus oeni]PDH76462.1 peptidase M20 [Oenococcus oeni]PDH77601.1 peptidase M20 [Oenococcus oeni]
MLRQEMSEDEFIEKNYNQWLTDFQELLSINSVRDDHLADTVHPYGPGPKAALKKMISFAIRDGFTRFGVIDNRAGYIEIGPKDARQTVGILIHVDVVPVDKELWNYEPFAGTIVDDRLYGRGSDDMKGSDMLSYYALKALKDRSSTFKNKVRLIIGTDEENDWQDMEAYFTAEGRPDLGFSPDSDFIVENAEKGIAHLDLISDSKILNPSNGQLLFLRAGKASNVVPGVARAAVKNVAFNRAQEIFQDFLKKEQLTGQIEEDSDGFKIILNGFSVHGSTPDEGRNAATYLALFLLNFDFDERTNRWLNFLAKTIHQDYFAEKLGIGITTPEMGKTTLNAGIVDLEINKTAKINLNLRYPIGFSGLKAVEIIENNFPWIKAYLRDDGLKPHLVPADDPVVTNLLSIYKQVTGKETHLNVSAGASFGRLMPRGVCYGTRFIGQQSTAHQIDEYFNLQNYQPAMRILIKSIEALANLD